MKKRSFVEATPLQTREAAAAFYQYKLAMETDPSDVYADMQAGVDNFVLIDVRSPQYFEEMHAQKAINIPEQQITAKRVADFPADTLFIVYCWGPGCNGSTKAAFKLSKLGYNVKEMIGGIEYWKEEGNPVEGSHENR